MSRFRGPFFMHDAFPAEHGAVGFIVNGAATRAGYSEVFRV